jgi:hypothetical protein
VREVFLPPPLRALLRPSDPGHFFRGGVQPQRALVAVEDDRRPPGTSSAAGSMPASAGRPSERAMIATCEVAPPRVVQKPATRERSSPAVSDGAEVLGDEDGARPVSAAGSPPGEDRQHAQAHVAQVVGALRQELIPQPAAGPRGS